jgi:hypothetical protein
MYDDIINYIPSYDEHNNYENSIDLLDIWKYFPISCSEVLVHHTIFNMLSTVLSWNT